MDTILVLQHRLLISPDVHFTPLERVEIEKVACHNARSPLPPEKPIFRV